MKKHNLLSPLPPKKSDDPSKSTKAAKSDDIASSDDTAKTDVTAAPAAAIFSETSSAKTTPAPTESLRSPAPLTWQQEMKRAIRDGHALLQAVGLRGAARSSGAGQGRAEALDPRFQEAQASFPVFVPPSLLSRIEPGNASDPILRQVLPSVDEQDPELNVGFGVDPLSEFSVAGESEIGGSMGPAIIQKYRSRALLITTGACGVHCRYCFRRHYPYATLPPDRSDWSAWVDPVAADPTLMEVILSGGDPLVLTDLSLQRLTQRLREIKHVRWLRIHSRMPVVIPSRVTAGLVESLQGFAACTMVIHCNHAREIDESVVQAIARLRQAGIQVLNQAVLLRGVNDSVAAQKELSLRLVEAGGLPYYLHHLDRVQGAAHFLVPLAQGQAIVTQLRQELPGFAVPRYVKEIPGQPHKTLVQAADDFSGI